MKFHEALTAAVEKGSKIRHKDWDTDSFITWDGKNFVSQSGKIFMMDLFICMNVEWEISEAKSVLFRSLPVGAKFKFHGEVLVKTYGYNATGYVTRTNHTIDNERLVEIVG